MTRNAAGPVARLAPALWGLPGATRGRRLVVALAWFVVAAPGCAALGPAALDVPPGQRVVMGRIDLARFDAPEALLEIVREDGTFRHDLRVGRGWRDFAITLPPGRYRIARVRLVDDRQSSPNQTIHTLSISFEVGSEPAVYVGTLQLVSGFGQRLEVAVLDEYESTVPGLRSRHPNIVEPVARSLLRPT